MDKPHFTSARKVAAGAAGLGLVATGIFGTSLFASWTTNRSADQDFVAGELDLAKINDTQLNDAFGDLDSNGGFADDDTGARVILLQNTGTLDYDSMKINATLGEITDTLTGRSGSEGLDNGYGAFDAGSSNVGNNGTGSEDDTGVGDTDTDFGAAAGDSTFAQVKVTLTYCAGGNYTGWSNDAVSSTANGACTDGWQALAGAANMPLNAIDDIDISDAIPASPTVGADLTNREDEVVLRLSYEVDAPQADTEVANAIEGASVQVLWEINVTQRDAQTTV